MPEAMRIIFKLACALPVAVFLVGAALTLVGCSSTSAPTSPAPKITLSSQTQPAQFDSTFSAVVGLFVTVEM